MAVPPSQYLKYALQMEMEAVSKVNQAPSLPTLMSSIQWSAKYYVKPEC